MRPSRRPNELVAYHEAGHAVASIVLDSRFDFVTIEANHNAMGRVVFTRPPDITAKMNAGDYSSPDVRHWFEREMVIAMAGPLAEYERYPQRYEVVAFAATLPDSDETAARKIAAAMFDNQTVVQIYLEFIEARACVLIDENWEAIERVAQTLIEKQKLTYDEVVAQIHALGSL